MSVNFFLVAESRGILEDKLASAGLSIAEVDDTFVSRDWPLSSDGEYNSPWRFYGPDGKPMEVPPEVHRGFGLPYSGDLGDIRTLFQKLERQGPAIARVAGIEFGGGLLADAPSWPHWCAGRRRGQSFSTREQANRLIGAESLVLNGLTGANVRILVVDHGLDADYIHAIGGSFGGGFGLVVDGDLRLPGKADREFVATEREHGAMMVRSLISLAKDATIYDLPLIPRRIRNVSNFALESALVYILAVSLLEILLPGPWVIVNAWGVTNRFGEATWGEYTANPTHPFNFWIGEIGQAHDVIFAAGNNGQFCPARRSGPYDRGPGRSILGANGHEQVMSIGAVRGDTSWVGTSSQGPAVLPAGVGSAASVEKPDLCAPSWFVETSDRGLISTGTSAASAVAAGAVAALRQKWKPGSISPAQLRAQLRDDARRDWHTGWNGRMGAGILDIPRTISSLPPE